MSRSVYIDQDIENAPLEIRTLNTPDSIKKVFLRFYTAQKTDAGGISILLSQSPKYQLLNCSGWTDFQENIPSVENKTWTIKVNKSAGIRMLVHCNEKLVVDKLLSDDMCNSTKNLKTWSKYWSGYMGIVKFTFEDTASTSYKPFIGKFHFFH